MGVKQGMAALLLLASAGSVPAADWEPLAVSVLEYAGNADDGARAGQALRLLLPLGGYGKDGGEWLGRLAGRLADGSWRGALDEARQTAAGLGGALPVASPPPSGGPQLFVLLLLDQVREDNVDQAVRLAEGLRQLFPEVPAVAGVAPELEQIRAGLKQRDRRLREAGWQLNRTRGDYERLQVQLTPGNLYEKRQLEQLTSAERQRLEGALARIEEERCAAERQRQEALALPDAKAAARALAAKVKAGGLGGLAP